MNNTLRQLLRALSNSDKSVPFEVQFWNGEKIRFGNAQPDFVLIFHTKYAQKRVLLSGILGFGEEYMTGNISVEGDFRQLTRLGASFHFEMKQLSLGTKIGIFFQYLKSLDTLRQAPQNISHHYDLGNDFYQLWLDDSMTYSSAYFRTDMDTLEQAQQQKYEHICKKMQLEQGETLIDIGCGWGGMLIYAARNYNIKGVGCTLSEQQAQYARERVQLQGLSDRITILKQDYRKTNGEFDKFVSIGMFEHVGKKFIPQFMKQTRTLLKPGGIGVLHFIGKEKATPGDPWTLKYIFPGGYIPLLDETVKAMGKENLIPIDIENLRLHYAKTLDEWSRRYEANVDKVAAKFDERFVRMWRLFLDGSANGFRYGTTRLYQITFTNGLNNLLPLTRDHLY